jgi:heat shock protein HtpX
VSLGHHELVMRDRGRTTGSLQPADLLPGIARARLVLLVLVLLAAGAAVMAGIVLYVSAGLLLEAAEMRGALDQRLPRLAAGLVIALPLLFWVMSLVLQRRNVGRTFYQQAANNRVASAVLMAALVGLLAAVGTIIGAAVAFEAEAGLLGAGLAALVGVLALLVARFIGRDVVTSAAHARPLDDGDRGGTPGSAIASAARQEVQDVTRELALAAGLPPPRLLVVDDPTINAFAIGHSPSEASITLTRGLVERLDREQLQGVIGHEMSHIRNLDSRYGMYLVMLVGLVAAITDGFLQVILRAWGEGVFLRGAEGSDDVRGAIGGFVLGILFGLFLLLVAVLLRTFAPLFAFALQAAVSREREHLADATAVELTRNPRGLERALEAVRDDERPLASTNRGLQHLWFENPVRGGSDRRAGLFDTHPSIQSRIERLRLLQGEAAVLAGAAADGATADAVKVD